MCAAHAQTLGRSAMQTGYRRLGLRSAMLVLSAGVCSLRTYFPDDASALPALANDFAVARYMSRRFPHPYTSRDAEDWVNTISRDSAFLTFAIDVDGALAGGIGFDFEDGERAGTAQVGYWLGRKFWGRGIATAALKVLVGYGFENVGLRRIQAYVMRPNVASARVLEHAGFVHEATLRGFYLDRDELVQDALVYAKLSPGLYVARKGEGVVTA